MDTVSVAVRRAGQTIASVERPLRYAEGGPAVVYRRKFWRYANGRIDLDSRPLDPDASISTPLVTLPKEAQQTTTLDADDTADRDTIRSAPASVRMLVEAGPGTGKTEMAARRLVGLVRSELSTGQILVLSFSRSAVRTLTRRLSRMGEADEQIVEELRHISIRTFDSWAFRILRLMGRSPSALLAQTHDDNIAELNALLVGPRSADLRTLIGDRRHLIVDEFQDLPGIRGELVLRLLQLLAPPGELGCGFTILGDPAQAIYAFAAREQGGYPGPDVYWKRIREAYGEELEVYALRRNYRAEAPLAELSADLRAMLLSEKSDEEKLLRIREAISALPSPAVPAGPAWLDGSEAGSRAVLTRTNGEALRVLQKLLGPGVEGPTTPVRLRAGSYAALPPAWIGALLRRLRSPTLTRSQFAKVYRYLADRWDAETQVKLALPSEHTAWMRLALAAGEPQDASAIPLPDLRSRLGWPDAFPDDQPVAEEGVIITTIHQSKGMEFDIVTLLDAARDEAEKADEDGSGEVTNTESDGEEANVGYVAMTRAGRVLDRIDGSELYRAPTNWTFQNDRHRLCCWRYGWMNMEMGLRGDLDPTGFADPALHDGASGVEALQEFLLRGARSLEGHKVMLCKHITDGKAVWHVHLQKASSPDRLIGRTAPQLTFDLLHVLYGKGYSLPSTIMNLRIASVGTVTTEGEIPLEEPERSSRLWLGVSLFGTGDFRTYKRVSNA